MLQVDAPHRARRPCVSTPLRISADPARRDTPSDQRSAYRIGDSHDADVGTGQQPALDARQRPAGMQVGGTVKDCDNRQAKQGTRERCVDAAHRASGRGSGWRRCGVPATPAHARESGSCLSLPAELSVSTSCLPQAGSKPPIVRDSGGRIVSVVAPPSAASDRNTVSAPPGPPVSMTCMTRTEGLSDVFKDARLWQDQVASPDLMPEGPPIAVPPVLRRLLRCPTGKNPEESREPGRGSFGP